MKKLLYFLFLIVLPFPVFAEHEFEGLREAFQLGIIIILILTATLSTISYFNYLKPKEILKLLRILFLILFSVIFLYFFYYYTLLAGYNFDDPYFIIGLSGFIGVVSFNILLLFLANRKEKRNKN